MDPFIYRECRATITARIPDTPDADAHPDRVLVQGRGTAHPQFQGGSVVFTEVGEYAIPQPIPVVIVDGELLVEVLAGDEAVTTQPLFLPVTVDERANQNWSWRLVFDFLTLGEYGEEVKHPPLSFPVEAGDGPLEISTVATPVIKSSGFVTRGAPGAGLQEITAANGEIVFSWDNGNTTTIGVPAAVPGPPGDKGDPGDVRFEGINPGITVRTNDVLIGDVTVPTTSGVDGQITSMHLGRAITPAEHLDALTAPDDYYIPSDASADPARGFPVARAGRLNTLNFNDAGTHRVQQYFPFRHAGFFIRYLYSNAPYTGAPYQGMPGGWQEFRNWAETQKAIQAATDALAARIAPPPERSDPTQWAAVGDSLTDGYSNGARWDEVDSYPSKLQAVLPSGTTVTNYGQSGATSDQINMLLGLVPYRVRIPSGAIPSSGTVTVETDQAIGGWNDTQDLSFSGHLAGVYGRLQRTAGAWSFSRTNTGTPVTASHATFRGYNGAMPTLDGISGHSLIVGYGRNDISKNVRGMEATIPDHVVRSYVDAYESMTAQHRQIVMLGTITRTDETPDSDGYRMVQEIGVRLRTLFPTHFLDLQGYLIGESVWADTGLTPTQADLDAQAQGMTPPSLFDDVTHYSRVTAQAIAENLVGPHIISKGWV